MLPPHIMMTLLPSEAIWRRWPERKPSPKPISSNMEPTPHAMPNMVRKARSLCDQMARKTSPKMSAGDCIAVTQSIRVERLSCSSCLLNVQSRHCFVGARSAGLEVVTHALALFRRKSRAQCQDATQGRGNVVDVIHHSDGFAG